MNSRRGIILVGGGGHCKAVIEVAESCGAQISGILDASLDSGQQILGYPVLGDDELMSSLVHDHCFLVTVGQIKNADARKLLHKKIKDVKGCLATLVASSAIVSKYATIGEGSVIMHHALVNADAKVGMGCIINSFANIEHDVILGDYCHVSTGAIINGNCFIQNETFIGSQAVIANGLTITSNSIISAGAFVRGNIEQKGIYGGNPAKLLKKVN
ncbi:MAG TPA: acetyltransferase [Marinilabiliaceae bacterium]|nr:acetyltransferase [Marinilabiliaceae bacterium]